MSQRTRARTTGDATRKAPEAAPTPSPSPAGKGEPEGSAGNLTPGPSPTQRGEPEQAPASSHPPTGGGELAPEALARTLRAVAAELERDPALARRIAEALAAPTPSRRGEPERATTPDRSATERGEPEGSAGSLTPDPSPRRRREPGAESRAGGTARTPRSRLRSESPLPVGEGFGVGAARVNRSFRPRLITGASPELGAGIPDPFALYAEKGEQGVRAALAELRTGSLRAIVREHRLDPAGRLAGNNDADKLRAAIVKAVLKAAR